MTRLHSANITALSAFMRQEAPTHRVQQVVWSAAPLWRQLITVAAATLLATAMAMIPSSGTR
jgi:anti-sigma-K factor RskA